MICQPRDQLDGEDAGSAEPVEYGRTPKLRAVYAGVAPLLADVAKRGGRGLDVWKVIEDIDQAWRQEDRRISYLMRQRQTSEWPAFREFWAEHERRRRRVTDTFDLNRRKHGSTAAAQMAAPKWEEATTPGKGERVALFEALVWETKIGEVLIAKLKKHLGRSVRFSRARNGVVGGPDLRLLVELFAIASTERGAADQMEGLPVRGNGIRKPGSAAWFARMLKRLRKQASKT